MIYADNAATTRTDMEVRELVYAILNDNWGNPGSIHSCGRRAREAVEEARERVAAALECGKNEVYFTSGGTESDNWALSGAVRLTGKRHVITSPFEHPAILNELRQNGCEVSFIPVDGNGFAAPEEIKPLIRRDTALISLMTANNELGTIQPVREAAAVAHENGLLFHTDAVQAAGHIPLSAGFADMLSISGHKFNAPKGVGVLCIGRGTGLPPMIAGGEQENGMRAGTENVPGAAALGLALKIASDGLNLTVPYVSRLRDRLREGLSSIPGVHFNTPTENVLPGILNVAFVGVEGEALMLLLDMKGICVSTGSACTSGKAHISHVLRAIGRSDTEASGAIRISLDRFNTENETDIIVETITGAVASLRRF